MVYRGLNSYRQRVRVITLFPWCFQLSTNLGKYFFLYLSVDIVLKKNKSNVV